jgi:hypothetical protein
MKRRQRIALATFAGLLSLPAMAMTLIIPTLAVMLGMVMAGVGDQPAKGPSLLSLALMFLDVLIGVVAAVLYWVCFIYVLVRFSRGERINGYLQVYCIGVVLYAVGEEFYIQLHCMMNLWYGPFSSLNAFSLFGLLLLGRREQANLREATNA